MMSNKKTEDNLWLIKRIVQHHIKGIPATAGIKLKLKPDNPVTVFHRGLHTVSSLIHFNMSTIRAKMRRENDYLEKNFPERRLAREIVAMRSSARSNTGSKPIGLHVLLKDESADSRKSRWKYCSLPILPRGTQVISLYTFADGERNYGQGLDERESENTITSSDTEDTTDVATGLATLHEGKHTSRDKEELRFVYNLGLRMILEQANDHVPLSSDHPLLSDNAVDEFLNTLRRHISKWWNREDRLSDTHGDPNPYNANIQPDHRIHWLDYGRITRGERGFDVGWLLGEFVRMYHKTKKGRFRELGNLFIEKYRLVSTDNEILHSLVLGLAVKFLVHMNPVYTDTSEIASSQSYHLHIKRIMEEGFFHWS